MCHTTRSFVTTTNQSSRPMSLTKPVNVVKTTFIHKEKSTDDKGSYTSAHNYEFQGPQHSNKFLMIQKPALPLHGHKHKDNLTQPHELQDRYAHAQAGEKKRCTKWF